MTSLDENRIQDLLIANLSTLCGHCALRCFSYNVLHIRASLVLQPDDENELQVSFESSIKAIDVDQNAIKNIFTDSVQSDTPRGVVNRKRKQQNGGPAVDMAKKIKTKHKKGLMQRLLNFGRWKPKERDKHPETFDTRLQINSNENPVTDISNSGTCKMQPSQSLTCIGETEKENFQTTTLKSEENVHLTFDAKSAKLGPIVCKSEDGQLNENNTDTELKFRRIDSEKPNAFRKNSLVCAVCRKRFTLRTNLTRHVRRMHREMDGGTMPDLSSIGQCKNLINSQSQVTNVERSTSTDYNSCGPGKHMAAGYSLKPNSKDKINLPFDNDAGTSQNSHRMNTDLLSNKVNQSKDGRQSATDHMIIKIHQSKDTTQSATDHVINKSCQSKGKEEPPERKKPVQRRLLPAPEPKSEELRDRLGQFEPQNSLPGVHNDEMGLNRSSVTNCVPKALSNPSTQCQDMFGQKKREKDGIEQRSQLQFTNTVVSQYANQVVQPLVSKVGGYTSANRTYFTASQLQRPDEIVKEPSARSEEDKSLELANTCSVSDESNKLQTSVHTTSTIKDKQNGVLQTSGHNLKRHDAPAPFEGWVDPNDYSRLTTSSMNAVLNAPRSNSVTRANSGQNCNKSAEEIVCNTCQHDDSLHSHNDSTNSFIDVVNLSHETGSNVDLNNSFSRLNPGLSHSVVSVSDNKRSVSVSPLPVNQFPSDQYLYPDGDYKRPMKSYSLNQLDVEGAYTAGAFYGNKQEENVPFSSSNSKWFGTLSSQRKTVSMEELTGNFEPPGIEETPKVLSSSLSQTTIGNLVDKARTNLLDQNCQEDQDPEIYQGEPLSPLIPNELQDESFSQSSFRCTKADDNRTYMTSSKMAAQTSGSRVIKDALEKVSAKLLENVHINLNRRPGLIANSTGFEPSVSKHVDLGRDDKDDCDNGSTVDQLSPIVSPPSGDVDLGSKFTFETSGTVASVPVNNRKSTDIKEALEKVSKEICKQNEIRAIKKDIIESVEKVTATHRQNLPLQSHDKCITKNTKASQMQDLPHRSGKVQTSSTAIQGKDGVHYSVTPQADTGGVNRNKTQVSSTIAANKHVSKSPTTILISPTSVKSPPSTNQQNDYAFPNQESFPTLGLYDFISPAKQSTINGASNTPFRSLGDMDTPFKMAAAFYNGVTSSGLSPFHGSPSGRFGGDRSVSETPGREKSPSYAQHMTNSLLSAVSPYNAMFVSDTLAHVNRLSPYQSLPPQFSPFKSPHRDLAGQAFDLALFSAHSQNNMGANSALLRSPGFYCTSGYPPFMAQSPGNGISGAISPNSSSLTSYDQVRKSPVMKVENVSPVTCNIKQDPNKTACAGSSAIADSLQQKYSPESSPSSNHSALKSSSFDNRDECLPAAKRRRNSSRAHRFDCALCDAKFTFRTNLTRHMKNVHDTNPGAV